MKLVILLLLVFFFLGTGFGQEKGSTLLNRFDKIPCSVFRGALDDFLVALSEDPTATGYVVLSDDANYLEVVQRRQMIENHIFSRNFDPKRVVFVRRPGMGRFELEFWKLDTDSQLGFSYASDWSYMLPDRSKPFVLLTGGFDASECPEARDRELVAKFLKANPRSKVNVVIRCRGRNCFRETQRAFTDDLVVRNGLSRSRMRFFYVPIDSDYYAYEFWILN